MLLWWWVTRLPGDPEGEGGAAFTDYQAAKKHADASPDTRAAYPGEYPWRACGSAQEMASAPRCARRASRDNPSHPL